MSQKRLRHAAIVALAVLSLSAGTLTSEAVAYPGSPGQHHESNQGEHNSKSAWENFSRAVKKHLVKPVLDIIGGGSGGGSGSVCK